MQRSTPDPGTPYDAVEAAIQLAKYAVVRRLCQGRRILDIACGEGYGSSYMMRWGAKTVTGMDDSEAAIERATEWFGESVLFVRGDVLAVDTLLPEQAFDLVISLDTVENVADPERFLYLLRKVAAPGAVIVVSCPNDAWYYGGVGSGHPYHLNQFSLEDFRDLSERILGEARDWALGGPMAGFGTTSVRTPLEASPTDSRRLMLGALDSEAALVLPADAGQGPTPVTAAYFLGLWGPGGAELSPTVAVIPLSMGVFESARVSAARWLAAGVFSPWTSKETSPIERRLARLEGELVQTRDELDQARVGLERTETELRHAQLRWEADRAELGVSVESIARMQAELDETRLPAARYRRLRSMVPGPLRRAVMLGYRGIVRHG